jgi:hypothetical protein
VQNFIGLPYRRIQVELASGRASTPERLALGVPRWFHQSLEQGGLHARMEGETAATEALVVRAGPGSSNSAQVRMIGKLDELLHGREYQNIADMLTSREGMKQLREWAKFDIKQIRWGGAGSAAVPATNAGITKGED